ncbi:MAG: hypothetical protein HY777_06900 [Betaproteobacteria bacterium]|nr:hypothetical protein [Betaproteobacteria bacterium]
MRKSPLLSIVAFCGVVAASSPFAAEINIVGLANTCNSCHGMDGFSAGQANPSIGGQSADYLNKVMREQRSGERYSSVMGRLLKSYTDEEIAALADHYSRQEWRAAVQERQLRLSLRGKRVHNMVCKKCHGAKDNKAKDETIRLGGQWAGYIQAVLNRYVDPKYQRPSDEMAEAVNSLSPEDIEAVSHFVASNK